MPVARKRGWQCIHAANKNKVVIGKRRTVQFDNDNEV